MTLTETPLPPFFTKIPGGAMASWFEAATKVANASTRTYIAGLEGIVEQQKLAQQASMDWISEVTSIQTNARQELVESFDSAKDEIADRAEQATSLANRASAEVVKSSHDAAASANRQQRRTLNETTRPKTSTRSKPTSGKSSRDTAASASRQQRRAPNETTRPKTPTTPKPTSRNASQSGPARWTGEAYESLTVAEVNEKLPQFSQRELREVETYEKAHQSRQTVLDKITALRGQAPVSGYDELNVQEIHKLISDGDDKLVASVRDYERPRKSRDGVLQAADAKLSKS
ncbi:MAG: hypothetical protein M3022_09195 [Actinomycetota bacterium]|nr:hypothetical protein [Actinomycetota bacterium]